ncbi:MAG: tryptophan--tRNA ligase [Rickettsiales bacterium]|nr:tryptophan--tRNA ligase [Rickettsiales bacterium]
MTNLVLSGVQPTGNLHLGNYLGAIKQWVEIQNKFPSLFCIVDLHAITIQQNPEELRKSSLEMVAAYIACGIDPKKSHIFLQSSVAAHSELAWIFSCFTPLGWLNRMTQFKEKTEKNIKTKLVFEENVSENEKLEIQKRIKKIKFDERDVIPSNAMLGLFSYPVLMAADILLYKATHIPVGDDQKQHLELTRDIANSINTKAGKIIFPEPEPLILSQAKRVMSLRDGTKKMSKSDESEFSRINLSDTEEQIMDKFKRAKSDALVGINFGDDANPRPEATNLLNIYSSLAEINLEDAQRKFADANWSAFKNALGELAVEKLSPITKKFNELKQDETYLLSVLKEGKIFANEIATKTLKEMQDFVGFLRV